MAREHCDMVLYNGKIVTVDNEFSIAEAVAIGGGRFIRAGKTAEIRGMAGADTKEIDLKGNTVLPGFIDSHPHVANHGTARATYLSLAGLHAIQAIKKCIAEKVREARPGEWIRTSPIGEPPDYHDPPDKLVEKRWPTRWDLDEVAPDNPVYVPTPGTTPNPMLTNSCGLRLLGISKDTPPEEHGIEVVLDAETGEPNGLLYGMHLWSLSPYRRKLMSLLPRPSYGQMMDGLREEIKDRNAAGVTTAYEGHSMTARHLAMHKDLWSRNELTMRVCFAYEIDIAKSADEIDRWMRELAHATGSGFGDDVLKICGVTTSLDGPTNFGAALMNRPQNHYLGGPTTGIEYVSTESLKRMALAAARNNLRMNVCCGGDRSGDMALEAYEEVNREIPIGDRRWVLMHVQHPTRDYVRRCGELGIAITTYTSVDYSKGADTYRRMLGGDYWKTSVPLRWWLDEGVLVAQSTDGAHYEPMFTIWESLRRIDGRTGESLLTPAKEITREEALRIFTIEGARVLFWEDRLGSNEPGKLADLVVLDNDILTCPVDEIRDAKVLATMVGGEMVYERLDLE
ncbi:MAG: amidohydrolase [Chloroflexi bacterium]|nr:amidohydrolase [Chloroflexota bacterium]